VSTAVTSRYSWDYRTTLTTNRGSPRNLPGSPVGSNARQTARLRQTCSRQEKRAMDLRLPHPALLEQLGVMREGKHVEPLHSCVNVLQDLLGGLLGLHVVLLAAMYVLCAN